MSASLPLPASTRGPETFTASAGQTVFDGGYPLQEAADVWVEKSTDDGDTWTTLTVGTHYAVTGLNDADGFTLTLVTACAAGDKIRHRGRAPIVDTTDFSPANTLKRAGLNLKIDRIIMHLQEMRRDVDSFVLTADELQDAVDEAEAAAAAAAAERALAEAARDVAVAAAGESLVNFSTRTAAAAQDLTAVPYVRLAGLTTVGVGGGLYVNRAGAEPSHAGKWQDAASNWFELAAENSTVSPSQFGGPTVTSIQAAFDFLAAVGGGGTVMCEKGQTYTGTVAPVMTPNTTIDWNRSLLELTLGSGNEYGFRPNNNCVIRNGAIHTISTGTPSSQFIFHNAISVGACNINGDSVASPDPFSTVHDITIENMTVSTTREGCPVIQIMGGPHNITIDGLTIPDSDKHSGIHADWGEIGGASIDGIDGSYSDQLERVQAWRDAYDAGTMYTLHPHNIKIRNVKAGVLSCPPSGDFGARILRLSGCYDVTMDTFTGEGVTQPMFEHVGGDIAFELAPSEVRRRAYRGIKVSNGTVTGCSRFGIFVDTFVDNVKAAVDLGYVPIGPTIYEGDIVIENVTVFGDNSGDGDGLRTNNSKGVRLNDFNASLFNYGVGIEDNVETLRMDGGRLFRNQGHGVYVKAVSTIKRLMFDGVYSYFNGTVTANSAGFSDQGSVRPVFKNCVVGADGEDTQPIGFDIQAAVSYATLHNNHVIDTKASGTAYKLGGTETYGVIWEFRGNSYDGGDTFRSGLAIVPIERKLTANGRYVGHYSSTKASLSGDTTPPSGSWLAGDTVFFEDPPAGGALGSVCTAAGSPGTWNQFGAVDA